MLFFKFHPKNKKTDDCVIRAIAKAINKTWEEVLTELYKISLKTGYMVNDDKCYNKYLESLGYKKQLQPRKADNTKYTGSEYCTYLSVNNPNGNLGNIIAHIGGHHMTCIMPINSGDEFNCRYKILDIWNCSNKCIGNYWVKGGRTAKN